MRRHIVIDWVRMSRVIDRGQLTFKYSLRIRLRKKKKRVKAALKQLVVMGGQLPFSSHARARLCDEENDDVAATEKARRRLRGENCAGRGSLEKQRCHVPSLVP